MTQQASIHALELARVHSDSLGSAAVEASKFDALQNQFDTLQQKHTKSLHTAELHFSEKTASHSLAIQSAEAASQADLLRLQTEIDTQRCDNASTVIAFEKRICELTAEHSIAISYTQQQVLQAGTELKVFQKQCDTLQATAELYGHAERYLMLVVYRIVF